MTPREAGRTPARRSTSGAATRALVALALLTLAACTHADANHLGVFPTSKPLPAVSGASLQPGGNPITTSAFRGKVLVLNFWATWCGPCRQEQGILQSVWQQYKDRGVAFLGVDQRDDPAAAAAQLHDLGVTYPNISDSDGAYADDFGFFGLPDTYLVDRSGTMRYEIIGRIHDAATLTSLLNRMLPGTSS